MKFSHSIFGIQIFCELKCSRPHVCAYKSRQFLNNWKVQRIDGILKWSSHFNLIIKREFFFCELMFVFNGKLRYENFRGLCKKKLISVRSKIKGVDHGWRIFIREKLESFTECKWRQWVAKPSSLQFTWSINWVLFQCALKLTGASMTVAVFIYRVQLYSRAVIFDFLTCRLNVVFNFNINIQYPCVRTYTSEPFHFK